MVDEVERMLEGERFSGPQFSRALEASLRKGASVESAAELYRRSLLRSAENHGEGFAEPPGPIVALVAKDVYAPLLRFLPILRERNNHWLVGEALEAIVTGSTEADVEPLVSALTTGLAGYTDPQLADFILALTHVDAFDPRGLKRRKAILKKGLGLVLAGRVFELPARARTYLGKLGLRGGAKPPRLPKQAPTTVPEVLELLRSLGVGLPAPKSVPAGLSAPLRAVYRATAGVAPWIAEAKELEANRKSMVRWLKDAELDEGIPLDALSPLASLVVFGKSPGGDFFFLDPKRYGELVFRFVHDEDEIRPESTSLGAFLTYAALESWAERVGLDDKRLAWIVSDRRAAARLFRSLRAR